MIDDKLTTTDTIRNRAVVIHRDHPEWGEFLLPTSDDDAARQAQACRRVANAQREEAEMARAKAIQLDAEADAMMNRALWLETNNFGEEV